MRSAKALQNEIVALQRRLDRAHERRAVLRRKVLNLRKTASRLTRHACGADCATREAGASLKQVYGSRSWRWTAPFRRSARRGSRPGYQVVGAQSAGMGAYGAHAAFAVATSRRSRNRAMRPLRRGILSEDVPRCRARRDSAPRALRRDWRARGTPAAPALRRQVLFGAQSQAVRESGANPLLHFVRHGAMAGRDPHPLFSVRYYLAAVPDIQATGLDPLSHYMTVGSQKGLTPHPLFDPAFYLDQHADVRAPGINPLVHFVEHGAREGRSPHPLFDAKFYLKGMRRDTPRVSVNPLRHYLEAGLRESARPASAVREQLLSRAGCGVKHLDITPLQHFVESGVHEGRRPNPFFDPTWYLQTYPDVAMSGQNPLCLLRNSRVGRRDTIRRRSSARPTISRRTTMSQAAGVVSFAHYLRDGRREGRLPRKGDGAGRFARSRRALYRSRSGSTVRTHIGTFQAGSPCCRRAHASDDHLSQPRRPLAPARRQRIPDRPYARSPAEVGLPDRPVLSPLSHPRPSRMRNGKRLAAAYGNVVHCERDGRVRHRLDECPDVLSSLDGHRTRNYAALLERGSTDGPRTSREALQVDRTFCHDALIATFVQLQKSLAPCAVMAEYMWMTRGLPLLDPGRPDRHRHASTFSRHITRRWARSASHGWNVPPEEEARRLARAQVIVAIQPEEARVLARSLLNARF